MRIKKVFAVPAATFCIALLVFDCKNDDNPRPNPVPTLDCVVATEVSSGQAILYEYDTDGNPLKITRLRANGSVESTIDILYNSLFLSNTMNTNSRYTKYDADIVLKKLPYKAEVSVTTDGITQANVIQYFFFYDDKNRLIKIGHQTIYVGDWEVDLNVYYNDKDNVVSLQGEYTTGPNIILEPVTVVAYDDKQTPYASLSFYKFLGNFSWESDPEPILTALSKNNPLDYTMGTFKRTMSYTYNDQGFPLTRSNTNTDLNGQYSFTQTYTYNCK